MLPGLWTFRCFGRKAPKATGRRQLVSRVAGDREIRVDRRMDGQTVVSWDERFTRSELTMGASASGAV
jgi:hypothetical protein